VQDVSVLKRIDYADLNSRQKENYNFHKVSARLADYGFNSIRLSDDWQGADFIAGHIDGDTFLKVQLKARFTIDKKYLGRGIHIAFLAGEACYLYPHDEIVEAVLALGVMNADAALWRDDGIRHWKKPPLWAQTLLAQYKV
jgi:hypothetical protein